MAIRLLNASDMRKLLSPARCVERLDDAMRAVSRQGNSAPLRTIVPGPNNQSLLCMPAIDPQLGFSATKLITLTPDNADSDMPVIQGYLSLFDIQTGRQISLMDAQVLSAQRTAAASALATRLLARRDAASCGIFGTGVQAVAHIDAIATVRRIECFRVYGRDESKTAAFVNAQAQKTGLNILQATSTEHAGACDVVCTVTASPTPILPGKHLRPGAHLNLVGAHTLSTREADSEVFRNSYVYLDQSDATRAEGGDVMIPLSEGVLSEKRLMGEIGQLLAGEINGRMDDQQITVYNSLGLGMQDLHVAVDAYKQACEKNIGTMLEL